MSTTSESKKNCIFVGGVPPTVTSDAVKAYFSQFGSVSKIKLNKSRGNQKDKTPFAVLHRGCGFIEMATQEGLSKVLKVKEHYLMDQKLDCRLAMTNRERKSYHQTLNQERRKIFIGKLPKTVTKEMIEAFFAPMVAIEDATLIQKESKDFAICFLLLKEKYAGEQLAGKTFEVAPGVTVECQMALFPQQLHQRKLAENNSSEPELNGSMQISGEEEDDKLLVEAYEWPEYPNTGSPNQEEPKYTETTKRKNSKKGEQSSDYQQLSSSYRPKEAANFDVMNGWQNPMRQPTLPRGSKAKLGGQFSSLVHVASSSTQGASSQDFADQESQAGFSPVSSFQSRNWTIAGQTTPLSAYQPLRTGSQGIGSYDHQYTCSNPTERDWRESRRHFQDYRQGQVNDGWSRRHAGQNPTYAYCSLYQRLKVLKFGNPNQRPGFPRLYSPFSF